MQEALGFSLDVEDEAVAESTSEHVLRLRHWYCKDFAPSLEVVGLAKAIYVASVGIGDEMESETVDGLPSLGFVGYPRLSQQSLGFAMQRRAVASAPIVAS